MTTISMATDDDIDRRARRSCRQSRILPRMPYRSLIATVVRSTSDSGSSAATAGSWGPL